jgi:hypothetical protein
MDIVSAIIKILTPIQIKRHAVSNAAVQAVLKF